MVPGSLTSEELAALPVTRPFLIRSSVIPMIQELYAALKEALHKEIPDSGLLSPDGLNLARFQIAKGDHHEGLPFAFLDFPKYFSREAMFTYRAFFWWGHPLALAMILKGPLLDQYKDRVTNRFPEMADRGFHLSLAPDPWNWHRGNHHTLELTSVNRDRLISHLPSLDYLKLLRLVDLEPLDTFEERILTEGVATFRMLKPVIGRESSVKSVYLFCPNLFWSSKVLEAGRHLAIPVQCFNRMADLEQAMSQSPSPGRVILDLDAVKDEDWEVVPRLRKLLPGDGFLWAVGSHVDIQSHKKAATLGCHQVWSRSEFSRKIEEILSGRG